MIKKDLSERSDRQIDVPEISKNDDTGLSASLAQHSEAPIEAKSGVPRYRFAAAKL
jgi:hypothetical protein